MSIFGIYTNRANSEEVISSRAMIIVNMNTAFSGPLFVLKFEAPDVPPDHAPKPASLCCKRTNPIRMADRTIWIQGKKLTK